MITINIAKDFSTAPGARYYKDGEDSGEEFYDKKLKIEFDRSLKLGVKLRIEMDGTAGYASSFINESFRRLSAEYGADLVWNNLEIISEEVPKYIEKVKESIYEIKD